MSDLKEELKDLILDVLWDGIRCTCDQCYWSPDECPIAELVLKLGVADKSDPCEFNRHKLVEILEQIIDVKIDKLKAMKK